MAAKPLCAGRRGPGQQQGSAVETEKLRLHPRPGRKARHALQQQTAQKSAFPDLAPEALAEAYPGRNQSLTQVLSSADSRLNGLSRQ